MYLYLLVSNLQPFIFLHLGCSVRCIACFYSLVCEFFFCSVLYDLLTKMDGGGCECEGRKKNDGNNDESDDAIMKCKVGGSESVKDALL